MEPSGPFPSDLPLATALYVSFARRSRSSLHVVFMNYVLAGAGLLARRPLSDRPESKLPGPARGSACASWLPSALGVAITAGVAPLLFIQICYQEAFFTANLLAFHRWMAIVPVLILAFYMLYVVSSSRVR